jgi:hypothetical protein
MLWSHPSAEMHGSTLELAAEREAPHPIRNLVVFPETWKYSLMKIAVLLQ